MVFVICDLRHVQAISVVGLRDAIPWVAANHKNSDNLRGGETV